MTSSRPVGRIIVMRIVRFLSAGAEHYGRQLDDQNAVEIQGGLLGPRRETGRRLRIEKLLAPLIPTDILCIGLNYREHAAESGSAIPTNPMLFIKASNTLNNPFDPIPIPRRSDQIDYEAELAVVIGKTAKDVSRADALSYVFGDTCANDVSAIPTGPPQGVGFARNPPVWMKDGDTVAVEIEKIGRLENTVRADARREKPE